LIYKNLKDVVDRSAMREETKRGLGDEIGKILGYRRKKNH
jgi:hypothetical protein